MPGASAGAVSPVQLLVLWVKMSLVISSRQCAFQEAKKCFNVSQGT